MPCRPERESAYDQFAFTYPPGNGYISFSYKVTRETNKRKQRAINPKDVRAIDVDSLGKKDVENRDLCSSWRDFYVRRRKG